jgi:hypothetical protein
MLSAAPIHLTTGVAMRPMQLVPALTAAVQSAAPKVQAQAADRIFNVNIQLGGGVLSQVVNLVSELDNLQRNVDSILAEIPGWHLTADIDKVPSFSGYVSGTIDEAANGALKSASLRLTVSADASATIEGYYGISVLHVGLGATAELTASVTASASYSTTRGWTFGGYASLGGSVRGFAEATAGLWMGELYAQGTVSSPLSVGSYGVVSGSVVLGGSVGADIQQYNIFQRQWNTIYDRSLSLGQYSLAHYGFNAVSLFQNAVNIAAPGSGVVV